MERRTWLVWLGSLLSLAALSAPLRAQDIPSALQDWKGWVLHDVPEHACPLLSMPGAAARARQCVWPGRLAVDATASGGHFSLDVHLDAPGWVPLPGDERSWPQQVRADGQPQPVLAIDGQPALWLTTGTHRLVGALPWASRPATLAVPEGIALVSLSIDGHPVQRVERHDDTLTLGEATATQRIADALAVRVYRQLHDGLPPTLETRLQLNVAGTAREQLLGPVLPAGFVGTSLSGELPARLDNDGRLRVQLRPGQWTITLEARASAPLAAIKLTLPGTPWPTREIWSYADNTDLRGTRVEGQAVDAARAGVPDDWRGLPAFALDTGHGLAIAEGNRGDAGGQGDQLHLQRELWLDFDGRGITAADHLTGTLRHRQRLDVTSPWQLQRAAQDGQPLLVSKGESGRSGVELRARALDLSAGLRVADHGGALPTSGWQAPLERIDATLHLPPGYRLLGASGADRSPDSWVAQWTLLDLFVVALIALLAGRALGWPWAALAAVFLALAQHEAGAPRWTLAIALALALFLRALPEGRLRLISRGMALAAFALAALWTLPFAATQLQFALHPQLASGGATPLRYAPRQVGVQRADKAKAERNDANGRTPPPKIVKQVVPPGGQEMEMSSNDGAPLQPAPALPPPPPAPLSSILVTAGSVVGASQPLDARSVVQAGAGTPEWDVGNDYRLGWSGPVTVDQQTRLVIAPAWLVRLLRVLMVALLTLLLARLVPLLLAPLQGHWRAWRGGAASAALLAFALLAPHPAQAQAAPGQALPDQAMLDRLRERLVELPKCAPDCAAVAQAHLQAAGDTLDVALDADAGAEVAWPLPQGGDSLTLVSVTVDGQDASLSRRRDALLLRMDRGVHRVVMHFRIGVADSASLRFPLTPGRVTFSGQGWRAGGIDQDHLLGDSVALSRERAAADGGNVPVAQSFPPYVRVTRRLMFGIDWTVQTVVQRLAPEEGGFTVGVPLLPGEHPLGDNAPVHDGVMSAAFSADSDSVSWQSRLDRSDKLSLTAPALGQRAEEWQVDAAPMWHVQASGVPTSASDVGLRFQPLPGETLTLALTEPPAVAGASLAFDRVQGARVAGERASETTLILTARSTRGGEHAITLPTGAELLEARGDGRALNLSVRDGRLSLPLLPGSHTYRLRLREPRGVALRTATSTLDLRAPVANIHLDLKLPQDRWVLWTWGPGMGPAVLYWSQLIVLLLAAWALSRYAPTPLRFHHWLLLGLGFSAFAWSAYALVVLWLVALGLRARRAAHGDQVFNVMQIVLAVLTALALAVLVAAVPRGLLGLPDMHVAGNGSNAWNLRWFDDRSEGALPVAGVFSVSLWVYKIAMLAWALWLANALIGWLRWGFEAWSEGGYWRKRAPKSTVIPPQLPTSTGKGTDSE